MKKKILMVFLFVIMFFVGNIDAKALTVCKKGDEGCKTTEEAKETINRDLNKLYKNARIACFYEVDIEYKSWGKTKKETYYNYIYYSDGGNSVFSASTVEGPTAYSHVKIDSAYVLGGAKNGINNYQCPTNSYIDLKNYNEVCYDNGGGECYKKKDGTDFTITKITKSSNIVDNNGDTLKYKNLQYKNVCDDRNLPNEYPATNTSGACRYEGYVNNVIQYILLFYNGTTSEIIYNKEGAQRFLLKYGETDRLIYDMEGNNLTKYTYNTYVNNIPNNISSCPTEIYLNKAPLTTISTTEFHHPYSFDLETSQNAEKTHVFNYHSCGGINEVVPETGYEDCYSFLNSAELTEDLDYIITIIRIAIPILLIVLLSYDIAMAAFGSEDKVKKIKGRIIKRIIIAIVIFFVPTLLELSFKLVNETWGSKYDTCGIAQRITK